MTQQQTQTLNNAFDFAGDLGGVGDAPISLIRHLVRSRPLSQSGHQIRRRNASASSELQLAAVR